MMNRSLSLLAILLCHIHVLACTSAIILGCSTTGGRPLLWKHRDTGHELNFIECVPANGADLGYVALFNGGDSLLAEAWTGVNEAGFAIMNTASYNLAPDTAVVKDREGLIMTLALKRCKSVDDFEVMLTELSTPMGVQANFGVIDALGNGAYFETDDYSFTRYDAKDTPDGVLIRTNFSYSGKYGEGLGLVRYINACCMLRPYIDERSVTHDILMDSLSCSFYHSGMNRDVLKSGYGKVLDKDFIPRYSTSASIVIEGVVPGESPADCVMWVKPGYPPCSSVFMATVDSVPEPLRPVADGYNSPEWIRLNEVKHSLFDRENNQYYIDLNRLR